jgi:hypothetical protein
MVVHTTKEAWVLLHCVPVGVPVAAGVRVAARNLELVLIEWLDSRRGEGWVRLDELESNVTSCRSVGWIIARDKTSVTLAGHLGENPDQCCGDLTIPRRSISKITPLSLKRV